MQKERFFTNALMKAPTQCSTFFIVVKWNCFCLSFFYAAVSDIYGKNRILCPFFVTFILQTSFLSFYVRVTLKRGPASCETCFYYLHKENGF